MANDPVLYESRERIAIITLNHKTLIPKSPAEISARTRRLIMEMEQSEDRVEGQAAFREKRKPRFTGR